MSLGVEHLRQAFTANYVSAARQVTYLDWKIGQNSVSIQGPKGCPAYSALVIIFVWNTGLKVLEKVVIICAGGTFTHFMSNTDLRKKI
jgi:hypothetical protein